MNPYGVSTVRNRYTELAGGLLVSEAQETIRVSGVETGLVSINTEVALHLSDFQAQTVQIRDSFPTLGDGIVTGQVVAT